MKCAGLSEVPFIIKTQTRTRIQVSRHSALYSLHRTFTDFNILPSWKIYNIINHINISKVKNYGYLERC